MDLREDLRDLPPVPPFAHLQSFASISSCMMQSNCLTYTQSNSVNFNCKSCNLFLLEVSHRVCALQISIWSNLCVAFLVPNLSNLNVC